MEEFAAFCQSFKEIMDKHPQLDIEVAREIIQQINEFLYTTHPHIGTIEKFGNTFNYFSDFHKFWHKHHQEILNCEIDECKCEQVADALHAVFIQTQGAAFTSVYDTCGLPDEDICRIRFLTANQDFRGSRNFSFLAEVFSNDNSIFDENNILADPDDFLKKIEVGNLSQNDKRLKYATNIAQFLLSHECTPYRLIDKYHRNIYALRNDLIACNAGYGNKKADMFVRDMVVLGIWQNVTGFERINVASDVNTIKVALKTGIIRTAIPLVSSFLDIFCYQYEYIDDMNAAAWRRVWEIWKQKYPKESISSPCLMDYFVYNVVGRQFCKESLPIFTCPNGHVFRWHSAKNTTCQVCYKQGILRVPASIKKKCMPCEDEEGAIAILNTEYVKSLPEGQKIPKCPFANICNDKKHLRPPKSISIMGQTGWQSAYTNKGEGGGGLMA